MPCQLKRLFQNINTEMGSDFTLSPRPRQAKPRFVHPVAGRSVMKACSHGRGEGRVRGRGRLGCDCRATPRCQHGHDSLPGQQGWRGPVPGGDSKHWYSRLLPAPAVTAGHGKIAGRPARLQLPSFVSSPGPASNDTKAWHGDSVQRAEGEACSFLLRHSLVPASIIYEVLTVFFWYCGPE